MISAFTISSGDTEINQTQNLPPEVHRPAGKTATRLAGMQFNRRRGVLPGCGSQRKLPCSANLAGRGHWHDKGGKDTAGNKTSRSRGKEEGK
jgi:hypothetical protein